MDKQPFYGADILLPKDRFEQWAVIACDQFTSERGYWQNAEELVGDAPSALKVILPEVYLEDDDLKERIDAIYTHMEDYLSGAVLETHKDAILYVERVQSDGRVRKGIVGAVDLDDYDYHPGTKAPIRATEETVVERIPPRVAVRKNAKMELPHVLLLVDDPNMTVIEGLSSKKEQMTLLYDTDLMLGGGHISAYRLTDLQKEELQNALSALVAQSDDKMLFAVGDGNHSLATAKECAKLTDCPLAKQALVEVVNLHDPAIDFEPIYRVLFGVDPMILYDAFYDAMGGEYTGSDGQRFEFVSRHGSKILTVAPKAKLPVGTLQPFLDDFMKKRPGTKIDYIHGEDTVFALCKAKNTVGILFKGMEKSELFDAVRQDGSLPRKTFSMGHAKDKRYYMEARKIKE